ncbi:MAG: phosphotransferase [Actinomycetota bacterium]
MRRGSPSAREAVESLRGRDRALPDLALVLDAHALEAELGFAPVVQRVRYKPGSSAVVAVRDPEGGSHWIATYADGAKLAKGVGRAARVGAEVTWLSPRTLTGPVAADRLLARVLARARRAAPALLEGAAVLRYNPHRRLVLRGRGSAIKLAAHPSDRGDEVARRLAAAGAAVLAPSSLRPGVTVTPWWGTSDLAHAPDSALERLAGAAIARVHRMPAASLPPLPSVDAAREADAAARAIGAVLPGLAGRAAALAARLRRAVGPGRPEVLVHGDWSPDQVLADGGEIRFIDFDRAAMAPAERDLGSALASGGSASGAEGYLEAGGRIDVDALDAWTSLSLLQRAIDPFRTGASEWPTAVELALSRAEEALP